MKVKSKQDQLAEVLSQKAYLSQQGLEYNEGNIAEYGLDGEIEYVATVEGRLIATHKNTYGTWLNIIDKQTKEMEGVEL